MSAGWLMPEPPGWREHVEIALREDIGTGDVSAAAVPLGTYSDWYVEAQQVGVACGIGVGVFILGGTACLTDGDTMAPGSILIQGSGDSRHLLSRERTALNYLMRLSGVATLTSEFVKAVAGTGCRILDTRKTTPGLRHMEKYAVRCGGGSGYRAGLYDMAMLKDNHLQAAGSVTGAIEAVRPTLSKGMKLEVECTDLTQVEQAVAAGADVVMLDNMGLDEMRNAVSTFRGRVEFEASGGVTLESVRRIAETGVDFISVGALTHSAPAASIHLEFGAVPQ